jgi:hypothetical protein
VTAIAEGPARGPAGPPPPPRQGRRPPHPSRHGNRLCARRRT